jgi:hypothetical protein
MQILHPSAGGLYTGLTNAVSTIYRIEGWRTLWKGVSSVIVGAGEDPRADGEDVVLMSLRQARLMQFTSVHTN